MSDQNVKSSAATSALQASLESPAPGQNIYDEAVFLSGWLYAPGRDPASCRVRAYLDDCCFAETRILSDRPDVCEKLGLSRGALTGFRMLGKIRPATTEPREATLRVVVSWDDEVPSPLAEQPVRLVPALLRERPYGEVVYPENETLLHRENIYGSGPPLEDPGIEVAKLLREYLPERSSVVDVGCGAGAYGPGLMAAGHNWLGLEANSHCCDILLRRQLPFRRVDLESRDLPCTDGEQDCAICIEVLEHVKDPEVFLREIARVIRGRALFSVPNMEVLPYFHGWRVVPWHLLEGDHKNFFTRASLRTLLRKYFRHVEIFPYGEHPLRTRDGIPLHVHLFAVADKMGPVCEVRCA
jgi:SAM-dependent methyltransferase